MPKRFDPNLIGGRGESIFNTIITRSHDNVESVFRPQFLGDKYPVIDFMVQIVRADGEWSPYFFVQAKATRKGYTSKRDRLRASVTGKDLADLMKLPAPTYVVGIDEPGERCFILAAIHGENVAISSFPTANDLGNSAILDKLREDVVTFWDHHGVQFTASALSDRG